MNTPGSMITIALVVSTFDAFYKLRSFEDKLHMPNVMLRHAFDNTFKDIFKDLWISSMRGDVSLFIFSCQ